MASNIGKKIIQVKEGIQVNIEGGRVAVTGPKGTLTTAIPSGIEVVIHDGELVVKKQSQNPSLEKFYGLTRSLVANMVKGVDTGFEKKLELSGVGYRARVEGKDLVLNVGFANPVKIVAPENIAFSTNENVITVSGMNKEQVGDVASKIRKVRPPDPYKGKGIKYLGEKLRKKVGKAAQKAGAK